jgi:hypothetical protein
MSPRWNWDSPTPLAASECALPPVPKGGGAHSPAAKGVGESQFQRLEKRLALCLLCGPYRSHKTQPIEAFPYQKMVRPIVIFSLLATIYATHIFVKKSFRKK